MAVPFLSVVFLLSGLAEFFGVRLVWPSVLA
jgi:hypothetical protein